MTVLAVACPRIEAHYDRQIRAWLLALMRYAITLDDEDRLVALAGASEIDKLGTRQSGDFRFFHRTSVKLCEAMANPGPSSTVILRCHLDRMSNPRMKRAFAAVLELDQRVIGPAAPVRLPRHDLWEGLRSEQAHSPSKNRKNTYNSIYY